jgi:hypothetical protein
MSALSAATWGNEDLNRRIAAVQGHYFSRSPVIGKTDNSRLPGPPSAGDTQCRNDNRGGTVPGVGEQISRADLASAAQQLRRVLATVPADPDHAAYLRGAADTLAMLADSGKCPETKVSGSGQHVATGETFPQEG